MTELKIRNILISDLESFLIKGWSCEENETSFLYKGFLIRGNLLYFVLIRIPLMHRDSATVITKIVLLQ